MAAPFRKVVCDCLWKIQCAPSWRNAVHVTVPYRQSNTLQNKTVEFHRKSDLAAEKEPPEEDASEVAPRDYKYIYPEFLPNPDLKRRDRITEHLERRDMYKRRAKIEIPEFYVGSVLAVTVTDQNAPGKKNRFVGICIQRAEHGLRANFTLRNVIDGQGVEVRYDLYNPLLQKIEVLKLEKRLDEELFYLRDAPAEYSTFPFDMDRVPLQPGAPVPVNTVKVKLGPRPWHDRWERMELQGVADLGLPERFYKRAEQLAEPWEKYDMMKIYRKTINEDETEQIMRKVHKNMHKINKDKKGPS